MGSIISCKENQIVPYETTDSQIVYNIPISPISKAERKRRKYRFKKKIDKQYLIV